MPKAYDHKMLILRGIRNLLDEASACEYARLRGYEPYVLKVSGEPGHDSEQVRRALTVLHEPSFRAIYGFSGGGYNTRHIINRMSNEARSRLDLVVIVGAPKLPQEWVEGHWELVYRLDPPPPRVHMDGPRALLEELRDVVA